MHEMTISACVPPFYSTQLERVPFFECFFRSFPTRPARVRGGLPDLVADLRERGRTSHGAGTRTDEGAVECPRVQAGLRFGQA